MDAVFIVAERLDPDRGKKSYAQREIERFFFFFFLRRFEAGLGQSFRDRRDERANRKNNTDNRRSLFRRKHHQDNN